MKRSEAEKLIGSRVEVWTADNGIYTGTLVAIAGAKGRPWRGVVEVDGILAPAQHFEAGSVCRRGFRVGEQLEAGGINISVTVKQGEPCYRTVLETEIARLQELLAGCAPHNRWALEGTLAGLRATCHCEAERTQSGVWDRKLQVSSFRELTRNGD